LIILNKEDKCPFKGVLLTVKEYDKLKRDQEILNQIEEEVTR
jgi:hypothetical protein